MFNLERLLTLDPLRSDPLGYDLDILGQAALAQQPAVLDLIPGPEFDRPYWVKLKVQMRKEGGGVQNASYLPYVFVSRMFAEAEWKVVAVGMTPKNDVIRLPLQGMGEFRAYVKEPGAEFDVGSAFVIPEHALPEGGESGRSVQPWLSLVVDPGATDDSWILRQELPNEFERPAAEYPAPASATLTKQHLEEAKALNLGNYVITNQLWADASRAYGSDHPVITASAHRAALELFYQEQLTVNGNDLILDMEDGARSIEFDSQATTGGASTRSFQEGGALMTRSESLRRTHPSVIAWWLEAMVTLGIHFARSTGAWRPHTGSTRHRYASALDLTHLRTRVADGDNGEAEVEIHLHRDDKPANPLAPAGDVNTPEKVRKRDFSLRFHQYLAERKQADELNWLGGPWELTYANVGLQGGAVFIEADAVHVHHVHLSVGSDQP